LNSLPSSLGEAVEVVLRVHRGVVALLFVELHNSLQLSVDVPDIQVVVAALLERASQPLLELSHIRSLGHVPPLEGHATALADELVEERVDFRPERAADTGNVERRSKMDIAPGLGPHGDEYLPLVVRHLHSPHRIHGATVLLFHVPEEVQLVKLAAVKTVLWLVVSVAFLFGSCHIQLFSIITKTYI